MYPVSHSPFLNYALALVWILAITNGLNLLDNMDGLAAGVSVISASGLMLVGHDPGPMAIGLLAMTAALLGFLVFNFHPAKIFMGDTGASGSDFS